MHIAWVTCILPQDMAFQIQVVPYPLFTARFNGESGTMQYHLTVKYIQHLIQFYSFWRSVWVLCNDIPALLLKKSSEICKNQLIKTREYRQKFF